jgi:hypothetical protein
MGADVIANLGGVEIDECIGAGEEPGCTPRFGAPAERRRWTPAVADRRLAELAGRQHGVVARWQLEPLGVSAQMIKSRLARGSLHLLHRGVYDVGHRALSAEGRSMAAVLAFGPEAVLSHQSAGQLWKIVPQFAIEPEVTRPGFARGRPGIVVHRSPLPDDETTIVDGIPVTSVPRTLVDLAGLGDERRLERAWNEMEVRELRDRLSVAAVLARHPGRRGTAPLRRLIDGKPLVGITRNELEEGFLALVDRFGLPRPRMNAHLALREKFYEVDCLWERQRVVVELDGHAVHGTRAAFEEDRERDRILLAEGFRVTRVTYRQMQETPAAVAADLAQILGSARSRVG